MEDEKDMNKQVCEKVETYIQNILDEGINETNLDILYKLIDIHKDLKNEHYWKVKEEKYMRYYGDDMYGRNSYGNDMYGGGRSRDSRGRFKGDDMMNEMHEHYRRYEEGKQGGYGNYGGNESMKALEYMLELNTDFLNMLKRDAKTPEEHQIIDEYTRKMSSL